MLSLITGISGLIGPVPVGSNLVRLKTVDEADAVEPFVRRILGAFRTARRSVRRGRNLHLRRQQQTLDFRDRVMGKILADLGGDLCFRFLRKGSAQFAKNFRRGDDYDLAKGV